MHEHRVVQSLVGRLERVESPGWGRWSEDSNGRALVEHDERVARFVANRTRLLAREVLGVLKDQRAARDLSKALWRS